MNITTTEVEKLLIELTEKIEEAKTAFAEGEKRPSILAIVSARKIISTLRKALGVMNKELTKFNKEEVQKLEKKKKLSKVANPVKEGFDEEKPKDMTDKVGAIDGTKPAETSDEEEIEDEEDAEELA